MTSRQYATLLYSLLAENSLIRGEVPDDAFGKTLGKTQCVDWGRRGAVGSAPHTACAASTIPVRPYPRVFWTMTGSCWTFCAHI